MLLQWKFIPIYMSNRTSLSFTRTAPEDIIEGARALCDASRQPASQPSPVIRAHSLWLWSVPDSQHASSAIRHIGTTHQPHPTAIPLLLILTDHHSSLFPPRFGDHVRSAATTKQAVRAPISQQQQQRQQRRRKKIAPPLRSIRLIFLHFFQVVFFCFVAHAMVRA